ncbi:hypothetical protein KCP73_24290 [Salmonella enterica subsp. enterica]|nr:hypothetical protein KCP73_24290 [Salmonella enterica subsp. enterica]
MPNDRVGNHKSGIVALKTRSMVARFTVSAGGQPTYSQDPLRRCRRDIRHAKPITI